MGVSVLVSRPLSFFPFTVIDVESVVSQVSPLDIRVLVCGRVCWMSLTFTTKHVTERDAGPMNHLKVGGCVDPLTTRCVAQSLTRAQHDPVSLGQAGRSTEFGYERQFSDDYGLGGG